MAVIVKSNTLFSGEAILPTAKQQSTNPDAVYSEYIARVEADGGGITDKAKLMDAIQFMFRQNLYGRMSTVVAPIYGKKLDSNGKLLKLYAIDGDDLESVSVGGAPLPHIDAHNQVVFNDTIEGAKDSAVGSYMTTSDSKVRAIAGRIGVATRVMSPYGIGTTQEDHYVAGLAEHIEDDSYVLPKMSVEMSTHLTGTITPRILGNPNRLLGFANTAANNPYTSNHSSSFITRFDYNKRLIRQASRYNETFDSFIAGERTDQDISINPYISELYIDFGGINSSGRYKGFGRFSCPFLWIFSDITEKHLQSFQRWQVKHYPLPA